MYEKLFLALIGTTSIHAEASREVFCSLSLSEGQPKVLYILRREDGIMQKKLASLCGVRESTLTVLLSKIEDKGLVRRDRALTDGGKSSLRVFLTEEGKRVADILDREMENLEEQGFHGFSAEEREQLLSMLARVTKNLKKQ